MNKELPIYKALIEGEDSGMYTISLVTNPAIESNFLYFNEQKLHHFKVENDEKRIVSGVIMRCDHPIYRVGLDGTEYYITFDKKTIETMVEKWLKEGLHTNVNLQHNPNLYVDGVLLKEVYIKDIERGINPIGFEDIEDGSLFGTYHITNDEVWESVKKGEFKGYSLEGVFKTVEYKMSMEDAEYMEIMEMLDKLENIKNKK